jgi:protein TonB
LLLSIAIHAAALVPLLRLGWHLPTEDAPPTRVVELELAPLPPPAVAPAPLPTPALAPPAHHPSKAAAAPPRPVAAAPSPSPATVPAEAASDTAPAPPPATRPSPAPQAAAGDIMGPYARALLARLEAHKRYPVLSRRRGEEGIVTLRLSVAADGRLVSAEPVGEAPQRLIDASLEAVRDAAPFPPLPAALQAAQAVFTLPVAYRLD